MTIHVTLPPLPPSASQTLSSAGSAPLILDPQHHLNLHMGSWGKCYRITELGWKVPQSSHSSTPLRWAGTPPTLRAGGSKPCPSDAPKPKWLNATKTRNLAGGGLEFYVVFSENCRMVWKFLLFSKTMI